MLYLYYKMTQIAPYMETLNNEQRQAVLHNGKGLLILAGAGSGKTRVITTKIAYLIRERGIDPRSILAVTFTNKAAREMADRARLIDERASDAMMRTFHSFGAWFLRRNANAAGLSSNFVIYDEDDMVSLLESIDETSPRPVIKEYAFLISRAKDYFLSPLDPKLEMIDYRPEFRKIYADYEERLKKIGNVDFGDLIKKPVELLRSNPDIARRFHDRFKVILVDEYQDSNIAQEHLLVCLTAPETYLCVVGDDDQSIYRFRGAEVQNILEFPKRFPGTDIIRLEQNYRSFSSILAVASSVVDYNEGRLGKTLRTERGRGKLPTLAFLPDQDQEAAFCGELIQNSVKNGAVYSDWAILYRTNAQSLGFESELLRRKIPYRVIGSLKFYQREEIKDALALLALLVNPFDEVAFRRIINKPTRGIGASSLDKILKAVYSADAQQGRPMNGQPIIGLIATACGLTLPAKAAAGVEAFAAFMEKAITLLDSGKASKTARADKSANADKSTNVDTTAEKPAKSGKNLVRASVGLSVCTASLIMDSGLARYHSTRTDMINEHQRLDNLQELVNAASQYPATREGLAEFLEHIELDRSVQENKGNSNVNTVSLLTLHNAKGLEFKRVILTGLEQGVFPRDEKAGEDLEEERRLFYVGTTRAMDELYFCSCAFRRLYGKICPMTPSRFLFEADKSFLRVIGNAPAGFGGNKNSAARNKAVTSSDGRWKTGDRIFHDDQGYGGVIAIAESEEGPVISVKFDNGYETRFLSLYQSGNFVKTGNEY